MTRAEYIVLFEKYLHGQATADEIDLIYAYRDEFEPQMTVDENSDNGYKAMEARLIRGFDSSIRFGRTRRLIYRIAIAAALLLGLGFGALYYTQTKPNPIIPTTAHLIVPGSNKAIVTLNSGKQIVLNDLSDGNIAHEGNVALKKEKVGLVKFNLSDTAASTMAEPEMVTVSTPKGGQYQVVLPDGTKVWLNAASYLKFPTRFTGTERKVELSGEGYFEVTKNKKMPFKVDFNKEQVTVLGTHFNIRAYQDDPESQTTLLEGSVKVTNDHFSKQIIPGEQVVCGSQQQNMLIVPARVDDVMAWKNGYFSFHKSDIQSVMRQASRWYDIDVVYKANLSDKIYGGRVSRFDNISELLKNLELTGTIHFKVEGRRVTVME